MRGWAQRIGAGVATLALGLAGAGPEFAQGSGQQQAEQVTATPQGGFVLKLNSELVLTNVVARDRKTGEFVRGLKPSDFSIYENGKKQQISTFDFETVDVATPLKEATISGLAESASGNGTKAAA